MRSKDNIAYNDLARLDINNKAQHDQMPLMLPKDRIDEWISPESNPVEIVPFALSDMIM